MRRKNRLIRDRFDKRERLSTLEVLMLKQHRLMEELENIAEEEHLQLIDNTKIVDQDRHRLASHVHLTAEGNLALAKALALVIKAYVLRTLHSVNSGRAMQASNPHLGVAATLHASRGMKQ